MKTIGEVREAVLDRIAINKGDVTPNGIYPRMSRAEYDALLRTNWSRLKTLGKSPAHFRHEFFAKDSPDTSTKKLGRVGHVAVLEPERFRTECAVWTDGRRAGKGWEAFKEANEGREIITEDEASYCNALQAAVRADVHAAKYVSRGQSEVSILWTHEVPTIAGLPGYTMNCKGRVDFVAGAGALVDLKTCRDASPEAFGKACWNFRYHVQAAFYADGYEAATGKRLPFVVVAVETSAPHVVQVYRIPEEILELGRQEYRSLLDRLNHCRNENHWPAYFEGEADLTLPKWAAPSEEEDAGDLGITFNQQGE